MNSFLTRCSLALLIGFLIVGRHHEVESSSISPNSMASVDTASIWDQTVGRASRLASELYNSVTGSPDQANKPPAANGADHELRCRGSACVGGDPDRNRNVTEVIRSRGFQAEEYDVVTRDGYILTIQRIVNPLLSPEARKRAKPVIMQHGLMSSSIDFVINSPNVRPSQWPPAKPEATPASKRNSIDTSEDDDDYDSLVFPDEEEKLANVTGALHDTQEHPNSLGFYLANRGYDVFLSNSRGNIYGQRHTRLSKWEPAFWSFTFDEQIEYDLPDTIEFVLNLTNKTKLGYVGHSQGTIMMFGLLSDKPDYADIVEPFVALAPVAYVNHCISPVKYFSYLTPLAQHVNSVFAPPNAAIKYLAPIVCEPMYIRKEVCGNIVFLATGFDWDELDDSRIDAYLAHMPSGTSLKNIAHYGQLVNSGRFAHFEHGILGNQMRYNRTRSPDYDLTKIRSKSIALFVAQNDWLASPKDVAHLLKDLTVKPHAIFNITELIPKWNHVDFVYAKHAGEIINTRVENVFRAFDDDEDDV